MCRSVEIEIPEFPKEFYKNWPGFSALEDHPKEAYQPDVVWQDGYRDGYLEAQAMRTFKTLVLTRIYGDANKLGMLNRAKELEETMGGVL